MNSLLIAFSFLISKLLGLVRDALLAGAFGIDLDVYYAAFRIPDFLFNLLSYGVLSAAFVPLFVERLKKNGEQEAHTFATETLYSVALAVLVISGLTALAAPWLISLIVPGFSEAQSAVAVNLTRLMLITPVFFTIGSIAGGVGNAQHRFWGIATAPVVYNLSIILGIIFLAPEYGVYGLTLGVIAGSMLHALVQIPDNITFFNLGRLRLFSASVKEMIRLSLPRILGMSVSQIALVVDVFIASTLTAGSITIMNFATNLEGLPLGLIGASISLVSFGTLSHFAASGDMKSLTKEIKTNLTRMLFFLLPVCVGMILLRSDIVELLLGYGKFSSTHVQITADTMGILLLGVIGGSSVLLLARSFYALKNTKTPVIISISIVALGIVLSVLLTHYFKWETKGLAAAHAVSATLHAGLLFTLLHRRLKTDLIEYAEIGKLLASTSVMAALVWIVHDFFPMWLAITAGIVSYTGAVVAFKSVEAKHGLTQVKKILTRVFE